MESRNEYLKSMEKDILFHLAIDTSTHDLKKMFGDVRFVLMGGSPNRMRRIADKLLHQLDIKLPAGQGLINISGGSDRYALYKAGPLICVSHGMGIPSMTILLHEIAKLVYYADCKDVVFLRLGTCGGLGVEPGTVVISSGCVDGLFQPYHEMNVVGKLVKRPAKFDKSIVDELQQIGNEIDGFQTVCGKTMCANDFYEEQGRLDGYICGYSEAEKMVFLEKARENGVCNIEMESLGFAAFCYHVGIKAAVICVTLVDRLKGDQITSTKAEREEWQDRPAFVAARYFQRHLGLRMD